MKARLRPFIQPTVTGAPSAYARHCQPIRLMSPTRSISSSSTMPVVQLQNPTLARRYTMTSAPHAAALHW